MNEHKVAFITCVNDDIEYEECCHYLEHLKLPDGWEKDVIAVREAPSMTAGYNAGMNSSDAKYKVYLHQDTFIINENFVTDLLHVFAQDEAIGLVGCIGATQIGEYARAVTTWDTGKIMHHCTPPLLEFHMDNEVYREVQAVDGLLIATQYDISWREDIFKGWDFYDISQCMEFYRQGKKVVVPNQTSPWCFHDNQYCKMADYYGYCISFAQEYQDIYPFQPVEPSQRAQEYEQLREQSRMELIRLLEAGKRMDIQEIFSQPQNRGFLHLREFQLIADISKREMIERSDLCVWEEGMSYVEVRDRVRLLEHLYRRIQFLPEEAEHIYKQMKLLFSPWAIEVIREV